MSTPKQFTITGKDGKPLTTAGHNKNGFDSQVSIDALRALWLTPNYTNNEQDKDASVVHPDGTISYTSLNRFPAVKLLPPAQQKRILITGGAGFLGSHLVDRLMLLGHQVTVLDNFFTGAKTTVSHWIGHPNFELVRHDVVNPYMTECDQIYHLACPASPPHYQYNSIKTVKTSFLGTLNMLGLAKRTKARFLIASTSEVYGDPEVHPQTEEYWGNVNPIGPRACYDEGKRVAETLTYGYQNQNNVDVRVVRIFNTYGPRMNPFDGRVVSNFIVQALKGEDLTVYGDGKQTRSFQFVHDLVDGMILLMNSDETRPTNVGSSDEFTIGEFAELVREIVEKVQEEDGSKPAKQCKVIYKPIPVDDPKQRRADTSRAKESLGWETRWSVRMGLEEMVRYYKAKLDEGNL
ncbi:NAD(P)-binding protein [Cylindrobasidium torrendii FP15055 ss-10]|uniref:UDP-glucuronate decarboxylase n=1 Tax=Cylindrobasidium torrendii FP15055 ss-10 TaxID=1314674 RepID=A0A0D7BNL4_9AGAR|nr:NAD(P)-binding protein [Cylindrobasidium torrendii FP15055 ss-10]